MTNYRTLLLWAPALCLTLSGCSALGFDRMHEVRAKKSEPPVAVSALPMRLPAEAREEDPSAGRLGRAGRHEPVPLMPDNPLRVDKAEVLSDYVAASGRLCRRVSALDNSAQRSTPESMRVICLNAHDQWQWVRPLIGESRQQRSFGQLPIVSVPASFLAGEAVESPPNEAAGAR